jgi:hypothetical protein
VNYAKLLEMNFFTLHSFLEVDKTQDLPSKFWQTLRDALILPNQKVVGYRSTSNHNFKRRLSTVTCIVPPVPPFTV